MVPKTGDEPVLFKQLGIFENTPVTFLVLMESAARRRFGVSSTSELTPRISRFWRTREVTNFGWEFAAKLIPNRIFKLA